MKHKRVRVLTALAVMVAISFVLSDAALGDTIQVKNDNDAGLGSLRATIVEANDRPGADVITFAPTVRGTISLKKALPPLRTVLEIRGAGVTRLTVRRSDAPGTPNFRIFSIPAGSNVTISGLKVSNGWSVGAPYGGAGIHNQGRLTLKVVKVSASTSVSGSGGGLYNGGIANVATSTFAQNYGGSLGGGIANDGTLSVASSTFFDNFAGEDGGGINNGPGATATVDDSSFVGNSGRGGGGIENAGDLTVTSSTFSNNFADRYGGAIDNSGDLRVERSTLANNEAYWGGGGAIGNSGDLTVDSSTLSANETEAGLADGNVGGGGIYNAGRTTVGYSTIAGNRASARGGGIYHASSDAADSSSLRATIVANNRAAEGPDASGTFVSEGYNLVEDPSGSTGFGPTDLQGVDPELDPNSLQDNGGLTRTIALLPESPAIDAVQTGCPPPEADQRGVARPRDGDDDGAALCDIGAFELILTR